jgi:anti-sigma factor RsiW
MDEKDLRKYLTPFADGELDVEQSVRILEHMAMSPAATKRVMHQQQLRQAVARHLLEQSAAAPINLRARVEAVLPAAAPVNIPFRPRRLIAMAVAAIIVMITGIWIGQYRTPVNVHFDASESYAAPFTTALIHTMKRTHVNCSRFATHSHSNLFPADLAQLPAALQKYLGVPCGGADLSEMQYTFIGAEPCPLPGAKTVHLLYRSAGSLRDTISVFVQPDVGQLKLEENHVYDVGPDPIHPVKIWREGGLVYYVVGDDKQQVERAFKLTSPSL